MQSLSWISIGFYCGFGVLVYYQQLHVKHFRGASEGFRLLLGLSAFLGMLTGLAYLGYYGWRVAWWAPLAIFAIGVASNVLGVILEKIVGALTLSLAAFVGWPVCAYFMFINVPQPA